ncbi:MAG: succinate dehydrogenase, hydrophobic membrane anchor protein [Pseudomonadota bacterium]|nr:succinate dehydrogenase, hydrophobic membrane anchor protein [Pseudomonadota bacterium]
MSRQTRQVGGSHRGLDMWLLQRASSVYMALFLPAFLVFVLLDTPLDHAAWSGLFIPLTMKVSVLLFIAAVLAHAWIGLREIFIDYVHFLLPRLALYFAFAALYLACLIWAVDILWSVN